MSLWNAFINIAMIGMDDTDLTLVRSLETYLNVAMM